MDDTITLKELIDMAHGDHNAALTAARYLDGWRYSHSTDGQRYYWRVGTDVVTRLPVIPHDECMKIIEEYAPGTIIEAFDACI